MILLPALTKVKSNKQKKKEVKHIKVTTTVLITVAAMLLEGVIIMSLWQFKFKDDFITDIVNENKDVGSNVFIATRDIASGEPIDGAIELKVVPSYLITSNLVESYDNTSELRASGNIVANTVITHTNTYNPKLEDVVIDTTRQVVVDYLQTPGIQQGDYVDIRLKVFTGGSTTNYDDKIVASKKCILNKQESGAIELMLSESDILNLNSAVVEAANGGSLDSESIKKSAELYVTKYVDPANQPKATVTYNGKGRNYTDQEIAESQEKLKAMINGDEGYSNPTLEDKVREQNNSLSDNSQETVEDTPDALGGE